MSTKKLRESLKSLRMTKVERHKGENGGEAEI
jgi:hypothetical protein